MRFPGFMHRQPRSAAGWFAARRAGVDARRERRFQDWLAASPANVEEYALCEIAWEVSGTAARLLPSPRPVRRAALLRRAVVAGTLAVACAALMVWAWPSSAQEWSTGAGEQRTLLLADGSRLTLNTRTQVAVQLGRHERRVWLEAGEAYFEVARDAARPFIVRTAFGSARAVGTRFNVYFDRARLSVTTVEGRVLVAGTGGGAGVYVDAGRRAEVGGARPAPRVSDADIAGTLDWQAQRIESRDEALGNVLEEFSRYTPLPVRAATPQVAALRVTAVLRTGDLAALEATLRGAYGLRMDRGDGAYLVTQPAAASAPRP
jgi:transmembrane sensor